MLGMGETDILWELGGEPLILNENQIKVIKRGSVRIYPFLVFDEFMNYNEMFVLANLVSSKLKNKDIDCEVINKNTYTFELNGSWNVVLSIKYTKDEKVFYAMMAIIHCTHYKKTYFCPFYNIEYVSLNHHSISCESSSVQFKIVEDVIKESLDGVRSINSFPKSTHLL